MFINMAGRMYVNTEQVLSADILEISSKPDENNRHSGIFHLQSNAK